MTAKNAREVGPGPYSAKCQCPIAQAVRAIPPFSEARVYTSVVHAKAKVLQLSRAAQRFIHRFDSKKPVKPFSFNLKVLK